MGLEYTVLDVYFILFINYSRVFETVPLALDVFNATLRIK